MTGRSLIVTRTRTGSSALDPVGQRELDLDRLVSDEARYRDRLGIDALQLRELVGIALDRDDRGSTVTSTISKPAAGVPVTTA